MRGPLPDWATTVLASLSGGGIIGYLIHGWIDDKFSRAKEARALRNSDIQALRDGLHIFLGQPKAHFSWLENVPNVLSAGGTPTPAEKADIIATWFYENAMKHPNDRRGPMYLIANVTYKLARGDRSFLEANPNGHEILEEAWSTLDEYAQHLTSVLHSPKRRCAKRRRSRAYPRQHARRRAVREI